MKKPLFGFDGQKVWLNLSRHEIWRDILHDQRLASLHHCAGAIAADLYQAIVFDRAVYASNDHENIYGYFEGSVASILNEKYAFECRACGMSRYKMFDIGGEAFICRDCGWSRRDIESGEVAQLQVLANALEGSILRKRGRPREIKLRQNDYTDGYGFSIFLASIGRIPPQNANMSFYACAKSYHHPKENGSPHPIWYKRAERRQRKLSRSRMRRMCRVAELWRAVLSHSEVKAFKYMIKEICFSWYFHQDNDTDFTILKRAKDWEEIIFGNMTNWRRTPLHGVPLAEFRKLKAKLLKFGIVEKRHEGVWINKPPKH